MDKPERGYVPTLDGLRGLAVLLVLATHIPTSFLAHVHPYAHHAAHLGGYLGVDIFFVLSGYLITRILVVEAEEGAPLRGFYLRRFFRIFPIYYLVLAVHAFVQMTPAVGWASVYLSNYYFAITRAPSLLSHTWSLAVEEHFYLLWPALIRIAPSRFRLWMCGVLAGISLIASLALVAARVPSAENLVYSGSQSRMFSLCAGSCVALLYPGAPPLLGRGLRAGTVIIGGAGVLLGLTVAYARSSWAFPINLAAFATLSVGLLLNALHASRRRALTAKLLTSRLLRETGRISYGLYLCHPFVYAFTFGHPALGIRGLLVGLPTGLQLLIAVATAYAVATVSFKLIERPLLALAPRRDRAPAPLELRTRT